MTQYFDTPTGPSQPRTITIEFRNQKYDFLTDDGVFSKGRLDYGSEVLLDTVMDDLSGRVLDLGCGYGPIGVLLGKFRPVELTMVDVNPRAVALARQNLKKHRVKATVLESDGFDKVTGPFDVILLNPPIRAGKAVIYRLFEDAHQALTPGGKLSIVIRKQQGADSAKRKLQEVFDSVETIARSGGFHVIEATKSALPDRDSTDHQPAEDSH